MKYTELTIKQMQEVFFEGREYEYEYFDEITQEWRCVSTNPYMERNSGFPVPEKALEPVSMFQIYDSELNQVIMIGVKDWKHKDTYLAKMKYPCKFITATDEYHLFEIYLKLFKELDPLILQAWNGSGFDFPYLRNRMKNLGLDVNRLSNYGKVSYSQELFQGRMSFKFSANGHHYIDMLDVYRKFVLAPRPDYTLDTISQIELSENKVQHTEYTRFDDFYQGLYNIPEKPTQEQLESEIYQVALRDGITDEVKELGHSEFCYYSYKDPILIMEIDKKRSLTGLMIKIAEKMGVLISDSLGTVKPWSQYIANSALESQKVMPPKTEFGDPSVVGGFVLDPVPGKNGWTVSFDVASMYPLLGMSGFNMSPETYINTPDLPPELRDIALSYYNDQNETERLKLPEEIKEATRNILKKHNVSMGINGAVFDKSYQGMIPRMVQEIYANRGDARKIQGKYQDAIIMLETAIRNKEQNNA